LRHRTSVSPPGAEPERPRNTAAWPGPGCGNITRMDASNGAESEYE
jgi:hypothetical protein